MDLMSRLVLLYDLRAGTPPRAPVARAAVRAAMLTDLITYGRVHAADDGISLDTTPLGRPPMDRFLAIVAADPERSLLWWVERGPNVVPDICEQLRAEGLWTRSRWRRRRPAPNAQTLDDAADLAAARDVVPGTPASAALAALALALGLDGGVDPPSAELVAASGQAAWFLPEAVEHLNDWRLDSAAWFHARNEGHGGGT